MMTAKPTPEAGAPPLDSTPARPSFRALVWPMALVLVLATVVLLVIVDLRFDIASGADSGHVDVELGALVFAIVGVVGTTAYLVWALRRARKLQQDLESTREVAERWRTEKEALLRRFGVSVEQHFLRWELTSAEKEIALLVLRGLSYREVAAVRGTAERTVRHQALAIYRKAGVVGRAEMAAVFLNDVLAAAGAEPEGPPEDDEPRPARRSTLAG